MDHLTAADYRVFSRQAEEKNWPLTPEEQGLIRALQAVPSTSALGWTIRRNVHRFQRATVRELMRDLKDHLRDTPEQLRAIIGDEAMALLQNL